jgi:hypothetical protein
MRETVGTLQNWRAAHTHDDGADPENPAPTQPAVRRWMTLVDWQVEVPASGTLQPVYDVAVINSLAYTHLDVTMVVLHQGMSDAQYENQGGYDLYWVLWGERPAFIPWPDDAGEYTSIAEGWVLVRSQVNRRGVHHLVPTWAGSGDQPRLNEWLYWPINGSVPIPETLKLAFAFRQPAVPIYPVFCFKAWIIGRYIEHGERLFVNGPCTG